MFDIKEYFINTEKESSSVIRNPYDKDYENIESDIANDIENIVDTENSNLYKADRFRQNKHSIDILYPIHEYPWNRSLLKGPDHIRFMLSIYPYEEDLNRISKVVLRPRHIEIGNIELMAIYLPERQILVQYLYYPHNYTIDDDKFYDTEKFMPFDISAMNNQHKLGKSAPSGNITVPPLIYAISTIAKKKSNTIDKFFVRINSSADKKILQTLDEISYHFSRYGY